MGATCAAGDPDRGRQKTRVCRPPPSLERSSAKFDVVIGTRAGFFQQKQRARNVTLRKPIRKRPGVFGTATVLLLWNLAPAAAIASRRPATRKRTLIGQRQFFDDA
jgi:hypothetical protein